MARQILGSHTQDAIHISSIDNFPVSQGSAVTHLRPVRTRYILFCDVIITNKSVFSLVNSAASGRRRPPLSIEMSCSGDAPQQTRRTPQRLSNDGRQTDRRTDGRTPDRYIDPAPYTNKLTMGMSFWLYLTARNDCNELSRPISGISSVT